MKRLKIRIKGDRRRHDCLVTNAEGVYCCRCKADIPKGMRCTWDGDPEDAIFICTLCQESPALTQA